MGQNVRMNLYFDIAPKTHFLNVTDDLSRRICLDVNVFLYEILAYQELQNDLSYKKLHLSKTNLSLVRAIIEFE